MISMIRKIKWEKILGKGQMMRQEVEWVITWANN
ncbi:hypothetical protein V6Z11_D08G049500 [Gossypium hirsutum]